uniref:Uncharacterized protein n=1 Tax=Ditylenchus dipsaci TaxID=166011 RepID=A0A915DK55_9BILA
MRAVLSSMSVSTNNTASSTLLAAPSTTAANDLHHLAFDPSSSLFSPRQLNNQRLLHTPTSFLTNNQQSAFYRNNNNLLGKNESNSFVDNNWFDNSHNSTIINESDFPSLGVRWSPRLLAYGSVAGSSPVVTPGGLLTSSAHHQASLHNALFNREATSAGLHSVMTRPYANLIRDGSSLGTTNEFRIQNEDFPALPGATLKNLDQLSADMISNENGQYPRDNMQTHGNKTGHSNSFGWTSDKYSA